MSEQIKLGELEPGTLFKKGDCYAVKSEYRTEKGICESYIVGSGEMFYGGTGNPNALKVEPIDLERLIQRSELLNKIESELEELYNNEQMGLADLGELVMNIFECD